MRRIPSPYDNVQPPVPYTADGYDDDYDDGYDYDVAGYYGNRFGGDNYGAIATNVTVDLSPEATDLITDTRYQLLKKIDVLSNEVSAAVRIASLGLVLAVSIGAVAFLLKK